MAEAGRRRDAAIGMVGAVAIGAFGTVGAAPPARADDFPTWGEVQQARRSASATAAEVDRITEHVATLQQQADAAGRAAQIAAEHAHRAEAAEAGARAEHARLTAQAEQAAQTASVARMRAGLLAAGLARGGGTARLLLDQGDADDLLGRLAATAQLSAQTRSVYDEARGTQLQAEALGAQASVAAEALQRASAAAAEALAEARSTAADAEAAVAGQQADRDRLLQQLATLRGTSARLAAQYVDGVLAQRDQEGAGGSPAADPAQSAPPAVSTPPGTGPTPSSSAPQPAAPQPSAPQPAAPRPSAAAEPPQPQAPPPAPVAAPNTAQAASAVAFARDQIGEPYRYGGAGPSAWDCSGLTMQAYASAGLGIGGHSATAQYRLAASQGRLVPYASVAVGDLVFYTDGGGDMYHVALYSGAGMMIEAPYPGANVREVPVRAADRVAQVARPTG